MTDEALFHHNYHRHRSSEEDREGAEQVTGSDVNHKIPRLPTTSLHRRSFLRLLQDGLLSRIRTSALLVEWFQRQGGQ